MMFELKSLAVYQLTIPYHFAFRPSADHAESSQIYWIKVETNNGIHGFGEFCIHKDCITKTFETANVFIEKYRSEWLDSIHDLGDLIIWIAENKQNIDAVPGVFSAVEAAILDAMAKYYGTSIPSLLAIDDTRQDINNIAVLQSHRLEKFMLQFSLYEQHKPGAYKMDLNGQFTTDNLRASFLSKSTNKNIGLNANNLWDSAETLGKYINTLPVTPFYIENPLSQTGNTSLLELTRHFKARIIIDESCLITHDGRVYADKKDKFIVKLNVPRLGGLLRTLNVIHHAAKSGFNIIIGENAGETSLSMSISRIAACAAKNKLVYQENIYSRHLFNEDLYKTSIINGNDNHAHSKVVSLTGTQPLTRNIKMIS